MFNALTPLARALAPLGSTFEGRLSIWARLTALALVTLMPLLLVTILYWRSVRADALFAESEIAGVIEARTIWPRLRDRIAADDCALADWTACRAGLAGVNAEVSRMRALADRSNLILDPELDTYYAMDLVMLRLPELLQSVDQLESWDHSGVGRSVDMDFVIWSGLGDLRRSAAAAQASAARALDYGGETATARFGPQLEGLSAALFELEQVAASEAEAIHDRRHSGTQEDGSTALRDARSEVAHAADSLWRAAAGHLELELHARVDGLERTLLASLVAALAALGLAGVLIGLISASIARPLRRLERSMTDLAAGRLEQPAPFVAYRNDIGRMARAVEVFRSGLKERAILERQLTQERDALEQRVAERTAALECAREAAEGVSRQLTLALDTVQAGILTARLDERDGVWVSPEAAEIIGRAPGRHDIRTLFREAIHPEDAAGLREALALVGRPGAVGDYDLRVIHGSGVQRWMRITFAQGESGEVIGLVMDVTARKLQELELAESRARAEAASEAKSAFLASMSHEIRTPLNGVLGMAAALARTPLDTRQQEMLSAINQSGEVLLTVLNDVLDLSKIEAGRLQIEVLPFRAEDCLDTVAALYRSAASEKRLDLRVEIDPAARDWVAGDAVRVRQILQNFVSNAIKFTAAGAVTLSVKAVAAGEGRLRLRFAVKDTGIGLRPDQIDRLFKKFSQADETITRRYGGTGLGLAISAELSALMGGEIGVDSVLDHGSTFWFEADFAQVAAPERVEPLADTGPRRAVRILAADDNPTNRIVLRTLLDHTDFEVHLVENGQQAVDAASMGAFDLVLMDVHMPVMDGMTAARAIRALPGSAGAVPIVALTADALASRVQECLAAGMTDHVAKPIRPEQLFAAIARALEPDESPTGQAAA